MTYSKSLFRYALLLLPGLMPAEYVCSATTRLAADEPNMPTARIAAKTTWLRQTVQCSPPPENVRLLLASSGNVTVYFNGQRLTRSAAFDDSWLAWDVTTLIRRGTNCLAVVLNRNDAEPATIAAWFDGLQSSQSKSNPWRITTDAPPIGWQQTDFNDRDWTVAEAGTPLDLTANSVRKIHQQTWTVDAGASRHNANGFRFREGDHVVLMGGTFIERAQEYGYLETSLNRLADGVHVTFRNLGWSADTVFAESRGIFDSPAKGYERMIEHVRAEEPTVIFLCYGQNEALEFPSPNAGIKKFVQQLNQLMTDLKPTGAEIILVTPHPFFETAQPLPNPTQWNPRLQEYAEVVKSVASETKTPLLDLFTDFAKAMQRSGAHDMVPDLAVNGLGSHPDLSRVHFQSWTDNGMHWNSSGYSRIGPLFAARLNGGQLVQHHVVVNYNTKQVLPTGGQVRNLNWSAQNRFGVEFDFRPDNLSSSPITVQLTDKMLDVLNGFHVTTHYESNPKMHLTKKVTSQGESILFSTNQNPRFELLRELTVKKNELYFHRWRPQNITYLFGFRKHEQGNNAVEIAQFDPLIDELEKQIHEAKQTQWQTITISQSDEQ